MSELADNKPGQFNILTWNLFMSKTLQREGLVHPQKVRLPAHIETLKSFHGSLDVVGIQEAAFEDGIHCGVALAEALGFPTNFFYKHNKPRRFVRKQGRRGRNNEFIGVFGARVAEATRINIGDHRLAVKTMVGSTAVVNFHFRQGLENRPFRVQHVEKLLEVADGYKHVALIGDTNEKIDKPARQLLVKNGYIPAAYIKYGDYRKLPKTYPTSEYHELMFSDADGAKKERVALDDISVKGLEVVDVGILPQVNLELPPEYDSEGMAISMPPAAPADHELLWATLEQVA